MAFAPKPDRCCFALTLRKTGNIHWMLGEELLGSCDDFSKNILTDSTRQIRFELFVGNFVWRFGFQIEIFIASIDEQIAIEPFSPINFLR